MVPSIVLFGALCWKTGLHEEGKEGVMKRWKQIKGQLNIWVVIPVVTAVLCCLCAVCVPLVQNGHHAFRDLIIAETSLGGGNRSGELTLFAVLLAIGSALTALAAFLWEAKERTFDEKKQRVLQAALCFLPSLFQLAIYGKTDGRTVVLSAVFALMLLINYDAFLQQAACFLCIYFAMFSVAAVFAIAFHKHWALDNKVFAGALLLYGVFAICQRMQRKGAKAGAAIIIQGAQLLMPLLLVSFLKNEYAASGGIETISYPKRYVALIGAMVAGLVLYQGYVLLCKKREMITCVTAFCICAFVSYTPAAMLVQGDMHHHGEQLIAWQQIVEFGQKAYDGYAPASGLFPMIIGGINRLLFHGQVTSYAMTMVIFTLLAELLTIWLIYHRVGGPLTVLIAFVFHMPAYCRVWLLLPIVLILSDKRLIERRAAWLLAWVTLIFAQGLYYPMLGVAMLLGTLPAACIIGHSFVKNKALRKVSKGEILFAVILLICIALCMPLLFRMGRHVLALAKQTIDVDGETILGKQVAAFFMPYLGEKSVRTQLYICARFVLGIVPVLVLLFLAVRVFKELFCAQKTDGQMTVAEHRATDRCTPENPGAFLMMTSMPVSMVLYYRYTMVCMDEQWVANLLSRSVFPIVIFGGLGLIVFLVEHGRTYLSKGSVHALIAVCFALPFLFFFDCDDYSFPYIAGRSDAQSDVLLSYEAKLMPHVVPEGYVRITDEVRAVYPDVEYARIGEGYVQESALQSLQTNEQWMNVYHSVDQDIRILGFEHSQLYYMLLGEKAVYSGRTAIAKDKAATEQVIRQIDPERTVVRSSVTSTEQYYLYRYLVQNGYVYLPEAKHYVPGALYAGITGRTDGSLAASPFTEPVDLQYAPLSFAKSIDSMKTVEDCGKVPYQVHVSGGMATVVLEKAVDGYAHDLVYLQLEQTTPKRIVLTFPSELCDDGVGRITFRSAGGAVLVPIGMNAGWLLGNQQTFTVQTEDGSDIGIADVKFYHLEDLEEY